MSFCTDQGSRLVPPTVPFCLFLIHELLELGAYGRQPPIFIPKLVLVTSHLALSPGRLSKPGCLPGFAPERARPQREKRAGLRAGRLLFEGKRHRPGFLFPPAYRAPPCIAADTSAQNAAAADCQRHPIIKGSPKLAQIANAAAKTAKIIPTNCHHHLTAARAGGAVGDS
jgi:hypothetical protein